MGIMHWTFSNRLKKKYNHLDVRNTYGYITKNTRIRNDLPKSHSVDALCIAGHPKAKSMESVYMQKKRRCHNRQIHKANFLKEGHKKNQANYLVEGIRLFDKVSYQGQVCFITGRRTTGYFALKDIEGNLMHKSASWKKLTLIETEKNYIIQEKRREAMPLAT